MDSMKKYLLFALIYSFGSTSLIAGTESGGGGGVVWIHSRPVLMDYFTLIESVEEIPESSLKEASRILEKKPRTISLNAQNESEVFNSNKAFAEADNILNRWSKLHFDVMTSMVKMAMTAPLKWKFIDESLSAPSFYLSEAIPLKSKIDVAAFYHQEGPSDVEVHLSRPIWNLMDLKGQTGLILHETLRQVQIGFQHGFDDQALQRATAIYLMCEPNGRLNYYMFYVLSNSPEMADKIYGSFKSFMNSECRRIK